jgi:hypothetical protein
MQIESGAVANKEYVPPTDRERVIGRFTKERDTKIELKYVMGIPPFSRLSP